MIFEGNLYNDDALDKERALILGTWKVPLAGLPTTDKFLWMFTLLAKRKQITKLYMVVYHI